MGEQDYELYQRLQQSDKRALELLYERYEKLLFSFAFRMTGRRDLSEEIVQEVFIKVWTKPDLYDQSKGKFSSWLLTITRNASIDHMRKKSEQSEGLSDHHQLQSREPAVEDTVQWKEEGKALRTAITHLAEDQQEIIELFYFKGLSQRTIADERNIPLGTVKGRIRLALKHLKKHLHTEKGGEKS
ncbi:sigma-70 family RNA polymerase sigma factor [Domibacillus sp. DTU_2020_1001157_1_SI_ALB_TIR_016]|uniref:RNA polymerase sigma factor n=1 Tax=Domibacillus sp. DTU_2020_1001157_1_SI_ALB_TIR_016 TaxID=3077789 RepID=UPI0028ED383E|nr:sigma-70 family RNA polymerase sigma factor [Domibacillus sp. DTU_2020_1001157_1_SI_ALB_TIR_016]WNS78410.1 sigma-70 family RNA polymerase sigma factor [Domibacillus sp. DTU_2020_1001157_1_SI_ALB_TIR_016]